MAVGARLLDLLDRLQAGDWVVVLVLDDLQWADRPSLRAVLFALRRLRADKVLIVVSARSGALVDAGWARFVGGDSRVMRVRLGGLEAGDLTHGIWPLPWVSGSCPTSGSAPVGNLGSVQQPAAGVTWTPPAPPRNAPWPSRRRRGS